MALSDLTDEQWFERLHRRRVNQLTKGIELWEYYDNRQPLRWVAKILEEQGDRFPPLKINWSKLFVNVLEQRLDWTGWRVPDTEDGQDQELVDTYEDNDLGELQGELTIASLVARQSYLMVGPGDDTPRITAEYPDQVAVEIDPITGRVVAALKAWSSDTERETYDMTTLYLPGRVITFEGAEKGDQESASWTNVLESQQSSPLVPVVPFFNHRRRWRGYSELRDLIPLIDAANQTATNMLAAVEHHALPRRWGINLSESDFTDKEGKPLAAWQIAAGAVWMVGRNAEDTGTLGEEAQPKVGQFSAADLQNFHGTIRTIALIASSLGGLDPRLVGYVTDQPASADGIRAAETELIMRAEAQQRARRMGYRHTGQLVLAALERDPKIRLEPVWRNAATPTLAAQADAAQKKLAAGIIDIEQAQEDCGYTLAQRAAMAKRRRSDVSQADQIVAGIRGLNVIGQTGGAPAPATDPVQQRAVPEQVPA